jgi:hypothetical protein
MPSAARATWAASLIAGALAMAACTSSAPKPPPGVEAGRPAKITEVNAGYLSDYARLETPRQWPTLLAWADLPASPVRIHIRPVEVWRGGSQEPREEDLAYVADTLARAVRVALGDGFELAPNPGPGIFELRVALTQPGPAVRRYARSGAALGRRTGPLSHATRDFLGAASLEAELLEPVHGRPAAAVLDRSAADEIPKGRLESWEDVLHVFSLWGTRLRAVFQAAPSL